jgi:gliding motility-associated-like protein
MKLKILLMLCVLAFAPSLQAARWYVNVNTGDDSYDGKDSVWDFATTGPKKTISNAIFSAFWNDTIYISEGIYQEILLVDKPLVIRGNNWGINPLTTNRKNETLIVPPYQALGSSISGNSVIEILSGYIHIDGLKILGDNSIIPSSSTKFGLEYDISFGIGGNGIYNDLSLSNLIISHFATAGIYFSGGIIANSGNKIENCKIKTGDFYSEGIILNDNFYCDLNFITIDSTYKGISFNTFSDRSSKSYTISYLNIASEMSGIALNNFFGNLDSLNFEYNVLNPFDANIDFTGFDLINLNCNGYLRISDNVINDSHKGVFIKNHGKNYKINFNANKFTNGDFGIDIFQPSTAIADNLTFKKSEFKNLNNSALHAHSEGGLLSILLNDTKIGQSSNGVQLYGNSTITPNNTEFSDITNYYFFLDSTLSGLKPFTNIDATGCYYQGTLGNNLTTAESFLVEDKIRHYLDRSDIAWILFNNQDLFVTANDGNTKLSSAVTIASNSWNIYTKKLNNTETVTIGKTLHLYPEKTSVIGKIVMLSKNKTLYLHGKISLSKGLEMVQGFIETTNSDSLIIHRNNLTTVLKPGNSSSYVKGPFYVKYLNLPTNFSVIDTIPSGLDNDYRPIYLNFKWPGISQATIGFKSVSGKLPLINLPSGISHVSDIRYWYIYEPYLLSGVSFNSIGFLYDSIAINDLVNDPNNLRIVYNSSGNSYNLGGNATSSKSGSIMSTKSSSGFGTYTLGNAIGGNNVLSPNEPVAVIKTSGHCTNDSITFSASNSRSESAVGIWEWSITGPSTIITTEKKETIKKKINVAGNYTVKLVVFNKKGYSDTTTQVITIDAIPLMSYTSKSPCFPVAIDVTNTSTLPPFTNIQEIEWKINASYYSTPNLKYSPSISGLQKGYLKIILNNGCSDTIAIALNSPVPPTISLIPNGNIKRCSGDSAVVLVNKSTGTVVWNDGKSYDTLILKSNSFKKAVISRSAECFTSDSLTFTILERPNVDAGPGFTIMPGKPVTFEGKSNGMIEWLPTIWLSDPTELTPICRPLSTTKYILRASNIVGCEAKDSLLVTVEAENFAVPNLLTPNGDGHNDTWVINNIPDLGMCDVNVYTREGSLVYSASPYEGAWDGTHDTSVVPDGYYVYVIENKNTGKVYTGILNIIK